VSRILNVSHSLLIVAGGSRRAGFACSTMACYVFWQFPP
jgi:hypothetical protein